jgi:hypothetical protein
MRDFFFSQKMVKFSVSFLLATSITLLAGCSDNTGGTGTGSTSGGTTGGGSTPPVATSSLTLVLTDSAGAPITFISNGTSANVKATLKDASGAVVANTVVTFSTSSTIATMSPLSGTALTDSAGVAAITLIGGSPGADTIKAIAQVGTTAVEGSMGYAVGANAVTISKPTFGVGAGALSAYGTTSITATVTGGGSGSQVVNFSSSCGSGDKAELSTGIATVGGVATGSYRDTGCASTDIVTVSVSGGLATNSANLVVTPPTSGSIQYVSSSPTNISLKGTGGTEVSQVVFKVLDTGNRPVSGKTVTFGLSTTVGGIILTPNTGAPFNVGTATSDAQGLVVTNVNTGTISTPVRVTASTCSDSTAGCATGIMLTTQSNQLTVTTGIPDQYGFSLAATTHNIEGWSIDGTTTVLTARLADHFKNPAPDGTAVVFTSEGASVSGQCTTVGGACSATFTSQDGRPSNGRVTVLAHAVGEETFTDYSADGWADLSPNEMFDPNVNSTDLPEAYVDYNENGAFDAGSETWQDFNRDGSYSAADGKFNGSLCDDVTAGRSSAGTCGVNRSLHVRQSQQIILSSSNANITINSGSLIALQPCASGGASLPVTVTVVDIHGNAMPAGTTIEFATSNGTLNTDPKIIVADSTGCRTGFSGCPAAVGSSTFGDMTVSLQTDASQPTCNNTKTNGIFSVKVTSPKGLISSAIVGISD